MLGQHPAEGRGLCVGSVFGSVRDRRGQAWKEGRRQSPRSCFLLILAVKPCKDLGSQECCSP